MATALTPAPPTRPARPVHYPDSDGKPMAENDLQYEWIVTIKGGLKTLFADREDVYVAGDLLWYYVEGDNKTCVAPDTMVVFGRPPGIRGSYRQWEEGGVCPQVVFEVLSPSNGFGEMMRKFHLYERLGVEEYYVLNPGDRAHPVLVETLDAWRRVEPGQPFVAVDKADGWRSPRLGVLFEFSPEGRLRIIRPDGRPFETFLELSQRADAERRRADAERQRADAAQERADSERQRADAERQRAEALLDQLRAAGIEPAGLA